MTDFDASLVRNPSEIPLACDTNRYRFMGSKGICPVRVATKAICKYLHVLGFAVSLCILLADLVHDRPNIQVFHSLHPNFQQTWVFKFRLTLYEFIHIPVSPDESSVKEGSSRR